MGVHAMKKITAGTWIENPPMGQRSLLLKLPSETGGRYFEMEYVCEPFAGRNAIPPHYHPTYTERFEILSGCARYLLDDAERTARAGDKIVLPPRIVHLHPWSDSDEVLRVRMLSQSPRPDPRGLSANLNAGITLYGLARDGKVNKDGLASIWQQAVSGYSILPGACPARLSVPVARVLLGTLALIGWLMGYRVSYPEYGSV